MPARLLELEVDAPSLAGNPLGDPSRRTVLAWLPPGHESGPLPAVYFLHGFTGTARGFTQAGPFQQSVPERLEALVASGALPPFAAVFPDGFTALGGTQWINAPAVGRYQDYVANDVVARVEAELGLVPHREARAIVGKSSGGYGALAMGRDRPDVFAHVACHSGDAGFEYCYLPEFPKAAAALLASPDPAAWLAEMKARARASKMTGGDHLVLNLLAMAAHYGPDPAAPLGLALPFDRDTARLRDDVWARWLAQDPVRFVPRSLEAFRELATLYVECGTRDEYHLRWGARMVVEALRQGGVAVDHEEFEDGHSGTSYRYDVSLRRIVPRLRRAC